jgi:hypothetical protein
MVFTNPIMIIFVNMTTNWPSMNLMDVGRYKNVDATNLRGGYWKSSIVIAQILDHKDGHYVRPNRVALKYPDFKKNVDPSVHVRMLNFVLKKM